MCRESSESVIYVIYVILDIPVMNFTSCLFVGLNTLSVKEINVLNHFILNTQ